MSSTATVTTRAKMDALVGGLLSQTGSWTVHLGTSSPTISVSVTLGAFADPFYPEYAPQVWDSLPLSVDLHGVVHALAGSVTFSAPSLMPQMLTTVWVTYTDASGDTQLLESWYLSSAPILFGPGGPDYIVNLGFSDFNGF
jgi:hypothetical protein